MLQAVTGSGRTWSFEWQLSLLAVNVLMFSLTGLLHHTVL
jgi:hypothetical protein